ncbi:enoyl-CoA delta isomerase 1, mitochondrial isoform X1 [Alligator mississippiensis]|uniref:enoyl-CoA delta isomerase 1, mitochondrial isoform X1 n=1 Tax=Alligator mississippiensis TaxID=8496 RepID=UPI002877504A|nr:enoyl-CoA delta isomerase 1, mitochondrial isoform X1 [Alligator mississippiensis]
MAAAGLARLVLGLGTVGARGAVSGPLSCWAGPGRASRRLFSNRNILVELEEGVGVAVMKMKSPPVNSLSLDFLTEFSISLEKLENDRGCRGVILTSGNCPAGGCLMAVSCDYRIMAENPKYSIGLNETQLGIVAPFWFKDTIANTIGHRATERSLQLGLLYSASDALKIGIVDELVPEEKVLNAAAATMSQWLAIPDYARQISKSMMRKPTLDRLLTHRESDIQNFVSFVTKDSIQKSLQTYMESLKQRKG